MTSPFFVTGKHPLSPRRLMTLSKGGEIQKKTLAYLQNELNALREAEDEERVAYERECRVKMEEEWKAREAVLRGELYSCDI